MMSKRNNVFPDCAASQIYELQKSQLSNNYARKGPEVLLLGAKKDMKQVWPCIDLLEQAQRRATIIIRELEHMKHKKVLPPSLIVLALASCEAALEPAGIGSVRHLGSFWQLLTEATPVRLYLPIPSITKTLPYKPIQHFKGKDNLKVPMQHTWIRVVNFLKSNAEIK
ncbi:hypothetical protein BTVI_140397 [Pitangus sulphuratus]|nr:hypothetical protein BTVI_140397 [Pitangus sulphuratus]